MRITLLALDGPAGTPPVVVGTLAVSADGHGGTRLVVRPTRQAGAGLPRMVRHTQAQHPDWTPQEILAHFLTRSSSTLVARPDDAEAQAVHDAARPDDASR